MALKMIFFTILCLFFGLYYILQGIMLCKRKVVIQHYSQREITYLFLSINFLIQTAFIDNNVVELEWIVMGTIPMVLLVSYIIYSRFKDIKYGIYNIDEETYKEIIESTLNESSIEFSFDGSDIRISKTPAYIEFINSGILIAEYKCITNYKKFLTILQKNIKEAKYKKKTKDWIGSILIGIFLVMIPIVLLIMIF